MQARYGFQVPNATRRSAEGVGVLLEDGLSCRGSVNGWMRNEPLSDGSNPLTYGVERRDRLLRTRGS